MPPSTDSWPSRSSRILYFDLVVFVRADRAELARHLRAVRPWAALRRDLEDGLFAADHARPADDDAVCRSADDAGADRLWVIFGLGLAGSALALVVRLLTAWIIPNWLSFALLAVVAISLAGLVNLVVLFGPFVQFRSLSIIGLHQESFGSDESGSAPRPEHHVDQPAAALDAFDDRTAALQPIDEPGFAEDAARITYTKSPASGSPYQESVNCGVCGLPQFARASPALGPQRPIVS